MSCNVVLDTCDSTDDEKLCCNIKLLNNDIKINWNCYKKFYNNYNRTKILPHTTTNLLTLSSTSKLPLVNNRFHCKDTSMISMGLFIIDCQTNTNANLENWIQERK